MAKYISEKRKTVYYVGMGLMMLGGILFISVFVTQIMQFGNFSNFESKRQTMMFQGFGGIVLVIIGKILERIGARGLAGSGVILDPEKARQDFEPYSRMAGGMVKDALDEAKTNFAVQREKVIMIKCSSCGKLNEESSKFCQECGKRL